MKKEQLVHDIVRTVKNNILFGNVCSTDPFIMTITPSMFHYTNFKTQLPIFLKEMWAQLICQEGVVEDIEQTLEEYKAFGQAYSIPTEILFQ
jgi:hypothetical protein